MNEYVCTNRKKTLLLINEIQCERSDKLKTYLAATVINVVFHSQWMESTSIFQFHCIFELNRFLKAITIGMIEARTINRDR